MRVKDEEWIKFLEEEHKIKPEVWKRHGIYFDQSFLYIPIKDHRTGKIGIKKRQSPTLNEGNKYLYPKGFSIGLYPDVSMVSTKKGIILCEGELDALSSTHFFRQLFSVFVNASHTIF